MLAKGTIIGLLTSLGLSRAEQTNSPFARDAGFISSNRVVLFGDPLDHFSVFEASQNTTVFYSNSGTTITHVYLKTYDKTGLEEKDQLIGSGTVSTTALAGPGGTDTQSKAELERKASPITLTVTTNSVILPWTVLALDDYLDKALYLKFAWSNSTTSGTSCSSLFAGYPGAEGDSLAQGLISGAGKNVGEPARAENITSSSSTSTSITSTEPTAQATTGPASETPSTAPAPSQGGLNEKGIIGVAVGAGGAGLLIAGVLIWLFCFRRRRSNSHRQGSLSYGSDSGAQVMMSGKEMPAVSESSPQSAYGGAEGRTSDAREDPYAPYSDRPITPPEAPRAVPAASTPGATSQTDLNSTRGADTPTPAINTRYAHLVEEGMTDHEIRQLEEEERHLDAAIAGRRVPS